MTRAIPQSTAGLPDKPAPSLRSGFRLSPSAPGLPHLARRSGAGLKSSRRNYSMVSGRLACDRATRSPYFGTQGTCNGGAPATRWTLSRAGATGPALARALAPVPQPPPGRVLAWLDRDAHRRGRRWLVAATVQDRRWPRCTCCSGVVDDWRATGAGGRGSREPQRGLRPPPRPPPDRPTAALAIRRAHRA